MSECIGHEPCPSCGSRDNLGRYDDGHGFCFGCGYYEDKEPAEHRKGKVEAVTKWNPVSGEYQDLPDRGLRETTLKFWQYQVGYLKDGTPAHIMNWKDEHGTRVGQKLRKPGKEFSWLGEGSDMLYGMWLWGKGKSITITEGELDALSVSQAFENKWPVVSLPNGSNSVKKTIKRCYDYLCAFDKIVLMFDMDEPGRKAVEEAAMMLPLGKVFVANLPEKDANEVLKKHGPAKIVQAFWDAKPYRPDGIVSGTDISLEAMMSEATKGYELRYPDLQDRLLGLRKGEITLFTAASGIGKSTLLRQLAYELHQDHKLTFGHVFLEEGNVKTAQAFVALDRDIPLGRLRHNPQLLTPEQWADSKARIVEQRMWFYNHFGSLESKRLLSKLHYMATVLKVDFICLDHISIVTSGLESSSEGERKDIDILMTRLRSLVEETGVGVLGVVHLKRVNDKNFNEGDAVSLTDLRGSASLEQLSDNVISMERNQQDETNKNKSLVRVLKCRETGDTGASDTLLYVRDTGKLVLSTAASAFKPVEQVSEKF